MRNIELDYSGALPFVKAEKLDWQRMAGERVLKTLREGTCEGSDFLGWMDLPAETGDGDLARVEACARALRGRADTVVVVGIGGSYLGAKAVVEAMSDSFGEPATRLLFAGNNVSGDYLYELLRHLEDKRFGICVISKSGTTTEPAVAFRLLRGLLERKVGKAAARDLVVAVTDRARGALRAAADKEGYETFVIPDNVGGRYSVLTPVGLLPVALAGLDARALVRGAADMRARCLDDGAAMPVGYAAMRHTLLRADFAIEIMVNYNPKLHHVAEWWKQLFGESEGKRHRGIFPAAADFTTDLHSMGQYIQQGRRNLFETVLSVERPRHELVLPADPGNLDGLDFLAGRRVEEINRKAEEGTREAHVEGGVPNLRVVIPELTEYYLGQLFYFFELACAISAGILGVNAFDQPGVEAYKRAMFRLLGKPE